MTVARRFVPCAIAAAVASSTSPAWSDCTPPTGISPCVDADALWIPPAPSRFVSIASALAPGTGTWHLGFDTSYLSRPVSFVARSPDPSGRTVRAVNDVLDAAVSAAFSPARHLELSAVLPAALLRTGTGMSGVTSQDGPALAPAALRDVRFGAGHDLVLRPEPTADLRVTAMSRLDLALPTGGDLAGSRGVTVAPSLAVGFEHGRLFLGTQQGARLHATTTLGNTRLGPSFVSSLGGGVHVLPDERLTLAVEGWLSAALSSQRRTLPDGGAITSASVIPAEWMLSAGTRLGPVTLQLGGGGGLPLSSETRHDPLGNETTDHFAAVTTPRYRFTLIVRYRPGS